MSSRIPDTTFPWLWVLCAFTGLFVVTVGFLPWFDEWARIAADVGVMISALLTALLVVLWRGLAPLAWFAGSRIAPFLAAYFAVMLAAAWINRPAGALQVLTVEAAYGVLMFGAALLWWHGGLRRRVLSTWTLGTLGLTAAFGLYESLRWFKDNSARYTLDALGDAPWHESAYALTRIPWKGFFSYPFYNPNYAATFIMPVAVAILAARRWGLFKPCAGWRLAGLSVLLMLPVMATTSKSAVCVYLVSLVLIDLRSFFLCGAVNLVVAAQLASSADLRWGMLAAAALAVVATVVSAVGRRRLFAGGVTFVLLTGVAAVWQSTPEDRAAAWETFTLDTSMGTRVWMWDGVWRAVVHGHAGPDLPVARDPAFAVVSPWVRRLVGYGPGEYQFRSAAWRDPDYYAGSYASDYTVHPHSAPMSMLADGGFAGLVVGLLLFSQLFNVLRRLTRAPGETALWARVLLVVATVLALHSLVTIATGFSVQRLHWVLVFGGTMALELGHRRREPEGRLWPAEFKGPLLAIVLGLTVVFCFKGSVVLIDRWRHFAAFEMTAGAFVERLDWEKDPSGRDPEQPPPRKVGLAEVEAVMLRAEASVLDRENRRWATFHVPKLLKRTAVTRERFRTTARETLGRERAVAWKRHTLQDLRFALEIAPDFVDLSRLYGEILFGVCVNARQSDVTAIQLEGQRRSIRDWEDEAVAWFSHSFRKGTLDYYGFKTLLDEPGMARLDRRAAEAVAQSPIFRPTFERRILAGAEMEIPLKRVWFRWMILRGEAGRLPEVLSACIDWVRATPRKHRPGLARDMAVDVLRRAGQGPVSPAIFGLLEAGGKVRTDSRDPIDYKLGLLRATIWGHGSQALETVDRMNTSEAEKDQLKSLIVDFMKNRGRR